MRKRANKGRLRDARVNAKTLKRYVLAVSRFWNWLIANNMPLALTYEELDGQICNWIEVLWEEGESKSYGNDTASGVQHLRMQKRILPASWSLLSTWTRLEIPSRAPPLLALMVLALAGYANAQSLHRVAAGLSLLSSHGRDADTEGQLNLYLGSLFAWSAGPTVDKDFTTARRPGDGDN